MNTTTQDRSMASKTAPPESLSNQNTASTDKKVFILSAVPLLVFVALTLFDFDMMSTVVNVSFAWAADTFGAFWQVLLLLTFLIGLVIAVSRAGNARLGNTRETDHTTFQWMSVIMCTLLAGGGVFWSAAEPIAYFASAPPVFAEASGQQAAINALAASFMDWGFLAWAILASLTGIVLCHLHYDRGLPLLPRTLLYPVFGDRVMRGWFGSIVDAVCVLSVAAGTIGPIGFLGLQLGYSLGELFGVPDTFGTQAAVIACISAIYVVSAMTGVTRGIRLLSRFNVLLGLGLMFFVVIFGPTAFIFDAFVQSFGTYVQKFIPMSTYRGDTQWLSSWMVFFWGWFLGYGPLMAMLVAKISRGRTIRQMILLVSVLAPIITTFWFTVVGGSGLAYELADPGLVTEAFEGFNLPAALLAITQQMPLGFLMSILFLVLTTIFVATTGDSMTYCIAMVMTGNDQPKTSVRVFWGVTMGVVAVLLVTMGNGGVGALQSFIVVTAVPVSFILLTTLWTAPMIARKMAQQQGFIKPEADADATEPA